MRPLAVCLRGGAYACQQEGRAHSSTAAIPESSFTPNITTPCHGPHD